MKPLFSLLVLIIVLVSAQVSAHQANQSTLLLDILGNKVQAELQIPTDELNLALPDELKTQPLASLAEERVALSAYLCKHFSAMSLDNNEKFAVKIESLQLGTINQIPTLVVTVDLIPPPGASPRAFSLMDNVVMHRVVNHKTTVTLRRDFANAQFAENPQLLGTIYYQNNTIVVNQASGSWWLGAKAMINLGVQHIAEGQDHILFMISLLIVAPMIRQRERKNLRMQWMWKASSSTTASLFNTLKVVSAFTLGHSVTLALSALKLISFPSQMVEIMVAVTIFFAAIHAIKPLFSGKDWLMAAVFGCIHGMAFASALENIGFDLKTFAIALFSFNLGIELAQLVIVMLIMPPLMLLSRVSKHYDVLRITVASFAAMAAFCWALERTFGVGNWFNVIVEYVFSVASYLLVLLAVFALLSVISVKFKPKGVVHNKMV